jgi:hypothetical protein
MEDVRDPVTFQSFSAPGRSDMDEMFGPTQADDAVRQALCYDSCYNRAVSRYVHLVIERMNPTDRGLVGQIRGRSIPRSHAQPGESNHRLTTLASGSSQWRNFVVRPSESSYRSNVAADRSAAAGESISREESD